MSRLASILGAVVIVVLAATTAYATQVQYRTPKQLGSDATLVVHGRVASVQSFWNASRTKILTEIQIQVDDAYKGAASGSVRVVQLGGVVGNVNMSVHGALSWTPQEEVLLFLEPGLPGSYQVSGYTQGKYRVTRRGGEPYVDAVVPGDVELVGRDARPHNTSKSQRLGVFVNDALELNR